MTDAEIRKLLAEAKTVAIVGLSSKPHRTSNQIGRYLQSRGYRIVPVNPNETEVLGEKAYADLASIPEPVDIVNVFRRSEEVLPVAQELITMDPRPKAFWLQVGVSDAASEALAEAAGIPALANACIMVLHKLLGPA